MKPIVLFSRTFARDLKRAHGVVYFHARGR
jgi:hypothetical protein